MNPPVPSDGSAWENLRRFTAARIGLGRAGAGVPTGETLNFKLAHAHARDAVHATLDSDSLLGELGAFTPETLHLHSAVADRAEYLRRPDLGRRLNEASRERLMSCDEPCDLALVLADGLSALAISRNAAPFLKCFLPLVADLKLGPIALVEQDRVAIGDEIGGLLRARLVVVLIGERPGLASPDSMGLYMTYAPQVGLTDESRNCISNVREAGLVHAAAAAKLAWLVRESLVRRLSGVDLKDGEQSALEGVAPVQELI